MLYLARYATKKATLPPPPKSGNARAMWRIIFRASIDSGAVHQQNASWQAPRAGLARDVILCDGRLALARACWFYRRSLQVSFRSPLPKRTAFYVEHLVTRLPHICNWVLPRSNSSELNGAIRETTSNDTASVRACSTPGFVIMSFAQS